MKKLLTLALFILAGSLALKAEFVWKTGYVILNSGDTLKGEVKYNTRKELSLFSKVAFRQGEVVKNYKPDQVKEYGYEEVRFVSRSLNKEMVFLKLLSFGRINLYEMQFEVYHGDKTLIESEYYIEKADEKSGEPHKVKGSKFKKTVAELMADHEELVGRVQSDDKKYEIAEMQSVVEEYNAWYADQNGLPMNGTR